MVSRQRGRLLKLEPPSFSHAPPQGLHVDTKEIRIPVFQCTRRHRILECHGSSTPASFLLHMGTLRPERGRDFTVTLQEWGLAALPPPSLRGRLSQAACSSTGKISRPRSSPQRACDGLSTGTRALRDQPHPTRESGTQLSSLTRPHLLFENLL